MDKTPEQLYAERVKRVEDAIQLKVPDRVPVAFSVGYFPAKYTRVTCADAYYDPAKWKEAVKKTVVDFEPDAIGIFVKKSGIEDKVKHRNFIIPGYAAGMSGELEEEMPDWKIMIGPREAAHLPPFLKDFKP